MIYSIFFSVLAFVAGIMLGRRVERGKNSNAIIKGHETANETQSEVDTLNRDDVLAELYDDDR